MVYVNNTSTCSRIQRNLSKHQTNSKYFITTKSQQRCTQTFFRGSNSRRIDAFLYRNMKSKIGEKQRQQLYRQNQTYRK